MWLTQKSKGMFSFRKWLHFLTVFFVLCTVLTSYIKSKVFASTFSYLFVYLFIYLFTGVFIYPLMPPQIIRFCDLQIMLTQLRNSHAVS